VQSGCVHQRSTTVSAIIAAARISPSSSEVAVPRVCSFNPTRLTCRNELDGDGRRHDGAFVPDEVYVVTTGIRTRQTSGTPRPPGSPHRTSHQLMFEQVSGAGASIRRFAFSGSCGTSWTATFAAGSVELSLRMMCSSPSPGSTNVSPA
jgi:hypothetical protein